MRSLERKTAADLVDQESGSVLKAHRLARHAATEAHQRFGNPALGLEAVDHLHQLHQRHRVEEMESGETLRRFQVRGDTGDGERGGIGCQYAIRRNHAFQLRKQFLLGFQILDDDLDHYLARLHVGRAAGDLDAVYRGDCFVPGYRALLRRAHQHLVDEVASLNGGARPAVSHQYLYAPGRGHLDDAPAHRARANHAHDEIRAIDV